METPRDNFVQYTLKRGAAALFGLAVKARTAGYEAGLLPISKVSGLKVVSIGNLRAGGSGKSPLAMFVAQKIQDMGVPAALLLRGYRGRLEHSGGLVSKGDGPLIGPDEAGDEAFVAATRLDGVQVWVGADRVDTAHKALRAGARVAVLDDGFQHRRLHRDLEILLVCPEDLDPETSLLPAGPLREHPSSAIRADLTCGLASDWKGRDHAPEVLIEYLPACLVLKEGHTTQLDQLRGTPVYLVSGVARPLRFKQTASIAGLKVVGASCFEDHRGFGIEDVQLFTDKARLARAKAILTTEKDMSRMQDLEVSLPLWALRIDVKVISDLKLLDRYLKTVL